MKKLLVILCLLQTKLAFAIIPGEETEVGKKIADGSVALSDIPAVILNIVSWGTEIAGSLAVVMLIYGGFQMIISEVTEKKEEAKNTIKYAIMGIIVAFSAWIIVDLVIVNLTK